MQVGAIISGILIIKSLLCKFTAFIREGMNHGRTTKANFDFRQNGVQAQFCH